MLWRITASYRGISAGDWVTGSSYDLPSLRRITPKWLSSGSVFHMTAACCHVGSRRIDLWFGCECLHAVPLSCSYASQQYRPAVMCRLLFLKNFVVIACL